MLLPTARARGTRSSVRLGRRMPPSASSFSRALLCRLVSLLGAPALSLHELGAILANSKGSARFDGQARSGASPAVGGWMTAMHLASSLQSSSGYAADRLVAQSPACRLPQSLG